MASSIRPIVQGTLPKRRIRVKGRGLKGEMIGFCRILRRAGLKITSGRIIDVFRCFDSLEATNLDNIYIASKSNLISSQDESMIFDAVFRQYWFDEEGNPYTGDESVQGDTQFEEEGEGQASEGGGSSEEGESDAEGEGQENPGLPSEDDVESAAEPGEQGDDDEGVPSYSPAEVISDKDFSALNMDQVAELRRLIAKLVPKLATKISRRKRPDMRSPEIDMRRSVKRSVRSGGEVLKLFRRRRKIQKTQIVLI